MRLHCGALAALTVVVVTGPGCRARVLEAGFWFETIAFDEPVWAAR